MQTHLKKRGRKDANLTYESLVDLEKYHSNIHHGEVQSLTHIKAFTNKIDVYVKNLIKRGHLAHGS